MGGIKSYFLSVIASSVVCCIVVGITDNKSVVSKAIKTMCGLFMIISVVSPLTNLRFNDLTGYFSDIAQQADAAAYYGQSAARDEMSAIIKKQTEAYILDKATALHMDICAEVEMSDTQTPIPKRVVIKGSVSPYGKQRMEQILMEELGIAKENQSWE